MCLCYTDKRHDEAHEKERDNALQAIRDSHRFNSFARERGIKPETGCDAKWYIDGHDFFWAVSKALDDAKESIMILCVSLPSPRRSERAWLQRLVAVARALPASSASRARGVAAGPSSQAQGRAGREDLHRAGNGRA